MTRPKFFRDPVHLQIRFEPVDISADPAALGDEQRLSWVLQKLIEAPEFQRLRGIRQNGLANLVFHGAEHSRFSHSMGVAHLARTMFERLCRNSSVQEDAYDKLQVGAASLVHDVGHGPFSHTLEEILKENGIPFHHEEMTRRFISEDESQISGVLRSIDDALPKLVCEFFDKERPADHWKYRIVSSQMDADRLDYTQRDALFAGVRGHGFDIERLLDLVFIHENSLAVDRGAIESVEAYLVTLDHLWRSIYYHHAVRSATKMVTSLFRRAMWLHRNGDKTIFPNRPGGEHYLARLIKDGGGKVPLPVYGRLSDATLWELVDWWSDSEDRVLNDLSRRLSSRRLFKSVDLDPFKIKEFLELQGKAREATKQWLGGDEALVDYYLMLDDPDRTSYKRYDWKAESRKESIWMRGAGRADAPIEEEGESNLIEALKKTRLFHRFIMPEEVRNMVAPR